MNSQVLTPLTLNRPLKHLSSQWLTKPLLLPWKFLRTPIKVVAKERRPKTLKALIKVKIEKSLDTAASQLGQTVDPVISKQQFRIGDFSYFYLFSVFLFVLFCFFKECIIFSLLSMKTFFFCFIHLHNVRYEIHCQSMMIFCHFNLNIINYRIL